MVSPEVEEAKRGGKRNLDFSCLEDFVGSGILLIDELVVEGEGVVNDFFSHCVPGSFLREEYRSLTFEFLKILLRSARAEGEAGRTLRVSEEVRVCYSNKARSLQEMYGEKGALRWAAKNYGKFLDPTKS